MLDDAAALTVVALAESSDVCRPATEESSRFLVVNLLVALNALTKKAVATVVVGVVEDEDP